MTMDKLSSQGTPEEMKKGEGELNKKQKTLSQFREISLSRLNEEEIELIKNNDFYVSLREGAGFISSQEKNSGVDIFVEKQKDGSFKGVSGDNKLSSKDAEELFNKFLKIALLQDEINLKGEEFYSEEEKLAKMEKSNHLYDSLSEEEKILETDCKLSVMMAKDETTVSGVSSLIGSVKEGALILLLLRNEGFLNDVRLSAEETQNLYRKYINIALYQQSLKPKTMLMA